MEIKFCKKASLRINGGKGLTLLALEGDVEVLAPVVHGEVLGGLEAGADQLGAHHADGHLLVRVPRVRLAQLAVEEVLLVLQHHPRSGTGRILIAFTSMCQCKYLKRIFAPAVGNQQLRERGRDEVSFRGDQVYTGLDAVVQCEFAARA